MILDDGLVLNRIRLERNPSSPPGGTLPVQFFILRLKDDQSISSDRKASAPLTSGSSPLSAGEHSSEFRTSAPGTLPLPGGRPLSVPLSQ
jgi:hypothetical protein